MARTSDTSAVEEIGAEIIVGDVRDRESVKEAVNGMDAVIHLADIYEFWIPHKKDYQAGATSPTW